ncbi:MAG: hypothetical protein JRJ84_10630 [Deltaproteobacteria bacterium]|nr:hypothetical protein [Deltaproteobacteria bacterium]
MSLALLLALALNAQAADETSLWSRHAVGVGLYPSGAIVDSRIQVRTPMHRSESILFRDTYAGIGLRGAASPAFVDIGPRISLAPIDILDVDIQGSWHGYYGGPFGLLPYEEPGSKLSVVRDTRADEIVAASAFTLSVAPTLKLKVGPIVAFDSWMVEAWSIQRPHDRTSEGERGGEIAEDYVYEPYRDLVIGWRDVVVEHQAAVAYVLLPGEDGAKLWIGPTFRDRWATGSGDRSTALGAMVIWRPGTATAVPTVVVQVLPYLRDADRVGRAPCIQAQVSWTLDDPVRR